MKLGKYVKEKEKELKNISKCRVENIESDRNRPDNERDYARILYSSSFRRLQGKMQLFIPNEENFHRNRLTHSLEVAQISHSIAQKIGMQDTLTVQSCSLAHDIGNPPFGHAGEKHLSACSPTSHYEGNAQTFRILRHIEEKHHDFNGLNLTIRTMLGIVKYPQKFSKSTKKYLYPKDFELIEKWIDNYKIKLRTIDCEIMDIADEIAYAAHDLEDALHKRCFSIDELLHEFQHHPIYKEAYNTFFKIVSRARNFASKGIVYRSSEEFETLFKKELTSDIVNTLVNDIDVIEEENNFKLGLKHVKLLSEALKKLTFNAITRKPNIIRYELVGKTVIQGLYNVYMDKKFNKENLLLPANYRESTNQERTVLDYIGGMMDSYAIAQYKIYYGKSSLEKLYVK
jgi:dGTPase